MPLTVKAGESRRKRADNAASSFSKYSPDLVIRFSAEKSVIVSAEKSVIFVAEKILILSAEKSLTFRRKYRDFQRGKERDFQCRKEQKECNFERRGPLFEHNFDSIFQGREPC